jgi:hypothetical protein
MTDTATKVIALLSTFAGRACLAAAIAIVALTQPLAPANAASAEERTPAGASLDFNEEDGTLYIDWSGPIRAGMADYLRTALGKYGTLSHRVVLFLDSAGGQVEEGDRVIQILNEAKQTHRLVTQVLDGNLCASMCIPVFLQGDDRLAARASHWIFHEAAKPGANGKERTDMTLCLFRRYYVPAGVSMELAKTGRGLETSISRGNEALIASNEPVCARSRQRSSRVCRPEGLARVLSAPRIS